MEYSVIIPLFNEQESLVLLQEELDVVLRKTNAAYEIIYIDDGSTDASLETLKGIRKRYPEVKIVSFKKHAGKSAALCAGFNVARGRFFITLDADLQNNPADIPELLRFKDQCDLIMGIRVKRQDSWLQRFSSGFAHGCRQLVLKDQTKDAGCALRVFRREVLDSVYLFRNFHRFFGYLVRAHGFTVKDIPVTHRPRSFGKSKYTTLKRLIEGIFDLFGVWWIQKRQIRYEIAYQSE
ncbi:MAG: glycosyltransferase family 2 protein [Candidatus Omnitrophica bacterium]|nr:glycosyltransferase family 2 protein [Candidatus Omnitrophota bacterium]